MNASHLWQVLKDDIQIEDASQGTITLHQRKLGELVLSTGHVVACDPLVFPDSRPFQETLPPGRYPLIASIASHDQCISYAFLLLDAQQPVRWEIATLAGQNSRSLKDDQIFGYPVDAGTACFMDVDAATGLQKRFDADPDYAESLIEDSLSHEDLNVTLNPYTGANAIIFSSGGDGFFASYWGYDGQDNIVCLLTDFGWIGHPAPKSKGPSLKIRLLNTFFHLFRR